MKGSLYDRGLLQSEWYPHIYAYYFKHWQAYEMAFHRHDSTEIMYMIHGACQIEVQCPDHSVDVLLLKKGDFILIDANVQHRLIVEQSCRMLNLEFGFSQASGEMPSLWSMTGDELSELWRRERSYWVLSDQDEVYAILKGLVVELDYQPSSQVPLIHLLFAQLLIRLSRLLEEAARSEVQPLEQYVRHSIEYLHHHYDQDIQVKDVAMAVNLHPGYVQRIFKQQTGRTMNSYLTSLRMDKAKMLLSRTDIPIIEISDYIGLNSRQYFHALFKKHTGMTPMDYRRSTASESRHYPQSGDDS
ncbi:AraC family transcriptional regulator [Paenibacillus sp. 1P07SE]|uniref:AraC family transcriptional regulator n=1 Tax=Paenibacillus sp. 1P07SE TaxID=3132209 RepID=UPI0039A5D67E